MASVAAATPKVLLPIGDRPFLSYLLQYLHRHGIVKVVLSTGYLGDQVADFVQCGRPWPMEISCIREPHPLGTGGAVRLAADVLQPLSSLLVLNGDTFFSGTPAQLVAFHEAQRRNLRHPGIGACGQRDAVWSRGGACTIRRGEVFRGKAPRRSAAGMDQRGHVHSGIVPCGLHSQRPSGISRAASVSVPGR